MSKLEAVGDESGSLVVDYIMMWVVDFLGFAFISVLLGAITMPAFAIPWNDFKILRGDVSSDDDTGNIDEEYCLSSMGPVDDESSEEEDGVKGS